MKLCFVSLGCDKNLVDSERMITLLSEEGFSLTDAEEEAEVIVINTCCFIDQAKSESIEEILRLAEYKTTGALKCLVAAGCLAQRYADEIKKELPEVDAVVGTGAIREIAGVVREALADGKASAVKEAKEPELCATERTIATPGHYEFLKIAEGCDRHCTYCVIPSVRGTYRSVPEEALIKEAETLAGQGVKELVIVAQETGHYGTDLGGKRLLPELLKKLCAIEPLHWIRLMYCYPEEITKELVEVMKNEPKVLHYLDMPIQHASDRILKAMGRNTTRQALEETIGFLKSEIPDIAIRTTLISGFPGEGEAEHSELMSFVEKMRFDRLGVFPYSAEEGTRAAAFPEQVPEEERVRRAGELMELQQKLVFEEGKRQIGRELSVLIEGQLPEDKVTVGRTYRDAPDVDGLIFLEDKPGTGPLMTGDFVRARVTGTKDYDLTGEITRVLSD